jgi:nucleoside-diphosphate-sugar epimerase
MNILITGGAGFIGSHLAEYHLERGDNVVTVDDLSTGSEQNVAPFLKNPQYRFEKGDILTWERMDQEIAVADRIYHMAAVVGMFRVLQQPVEVTRVNVQGTERILDGIARSKNRPVVVVASSSSVYGHSHAPALREEAEIVVPLTNDALVGYGLSKLTNEIQAMAYRQAHGLSVAIPRLFNAVGPRQQGSYGFVLPRFIEQAVSGRPLTVFGDGSQTRSFCDVRDTVVALDLLAENPACWGQPVNVGNSREISILDVAKLVISRSGSRSAIEFMPFEKGYGKNFKHILQRRPVLEKLQQLTSFQPAWTLESTIDYLLKREYTQPDSGASLP